MTKIALCGNPNAGKTTVFNALSGMNLRVGNYNGATVSAFETEVTKDTSICDLPGVFSLSPILPTKSPPASILKIKPTVRLSWLTEHHPRIPRRYLPHFAR